MDHGMMAKTHTLSLHRAQYLVLHPCPVVLTFVAGKTTARVYINYCVLA